MRWLWLSLIALAWPGLARADAIEDFYRGKTLNLMIGSGAGGGVDQVSRAVARHLGKHVPGNPTVVPRNMGGAGGLQVLNHIQSVAPKDGSTIGIVLPSLVFDPLFTGKSEGYDPLRLKWLGGPARYASVAIAWNARDAGAQGAGPAHAGARGRRRVSRPRAAPAMPT